MNYKATEIEVPQDEPFKFDKLNRKEEVLNISHLLQHISSPIVFSINAPWGTGKSTFLKMLDKVLLNSDKKSIYFSAWETDFADDPLLAFLGEINESLKYKDDTKKAQAWENAKKASGQIIKKSFPVALKLATMGILDLDKITEDELSKLTESYSEDLIKEYENSKSAITEFKKNISHITSEGENDTLYIIIDELDRCRPTYAIELLERIKHLLNIEGLVFVLALDREQLSHSVRGIYGNDFEAKGYLKRFIDIEYSLNEINVEVYVNYLFDHFKISDFLNQNYRRKNSALQYEEDHLKKVIIHLVSRYKLSLRDIEQLMARLNLVILSTDYNQFTYPALLAFLLIVKQYHNNDYKNFIKENTSPKPLLDLLKEIFPSNERYNLYECALIEGYIISSKLTDHNKLGRDVFDNYKKELENDKISDEKRQYLDRVIRIADRPAGALGRRVSLNHLVQRIEMVKQFNFSTSGSESE